VILGGRYEVGELLGRGGMAEVRKGTDVRLGRVVAVKRLRTDLATDPTFQARFRREAQAAAALNHPAIVSVYDTGEEISPDGSHPQPYIVMEYVAGRTLRDILREGRKILPERALEITSGVLAALDYSHRAGIVHRDIKPANVMLTPAGDVKVMDFGIARAVTDASSTMTQTAAVVGTAQYLSPEQARGETVDSRSDVYSTGCLLYELLTGRPPFVGDSPVSVAYQHVREQAQPPSAFEPSLPPEVDAIVMKALAKRTDERYQGAAAMRSDIERYLAGKPVEAPAPVAPPAEPTTLMAGAEEYETPTRRRWPMVLLLVLVLVLLAGGVAAGVRLFGSGGEDVSVPSLANMTLNEAEQRLESAGLVLGDVTRENSDDVPRNRVISQDPAARSTVADGSEVDVVVSAGTEQVTIPYVIGRDKDAARSELEGLDLQVELREEESDAPRDSVVATDPEAAETVPVGSTVVVSWSSGPVTVPSVVGLTEAQAKRRLTDAGFDVAVVRDSTTPAEKGRVLAQSPEALTEQSRGSTVTITVSAYEEPTETPTPTPTETPTTATPTPTTSPSTPPDENQGEDGQ
jgi:serine/threonine-protein kinase